MRLAILDLGTNTFHLLIADVGKDHSYKIVYKTRAVVKLGKGGINENFIAEVPFRKGIKVISHFENIAREKGAEKVFAFATSAIRSGSNGKEFVSETKKQTGIPIKIISGEEEAKLIYYGVRQCVDLDEQPSLIMDIGGGSTEFIIANQKKIFWKHSFNIGVARLREQFNPSDPITKKQINQLEKYLDEMLQPLNDSIKKIPVKKLVGSSGSFDTLAEMIGYRYYDKNVVAGKRSYDFNLDEYNLVHEWLLKSTTAMRLKVKGLIHMRVDMIVVSSICTNYILKKFGIRKMLLSKYALKEGALWEIASNFEH